MESLIHNRNSAPTLPRRSEVYRLESMAASRPLIEDSKKRVWTGANISGTWHNRKAEKGIRPPGSPVLISQAFEPDFPDPDVLKTHFRYSSQATTILRRGDYAFADQYYSGDAEEADSSGSLANSRLFYITYAPYFGRPLTASEYHEKELGSYFRRDCHGTREGSRCTGQLLCHLMAPDFSTYFAIG